MNQVHHVTAKLEELKPLQEELRKQGYTYIRVSCAPTDSTSYFLTAYKTYPFSKNILDGEPKYEHQ